MPAIIRSICYSAASFALKRIRILAAMGVAGIILGFAIWDAASYLATPAALPKRADCIVVLGGDNGDRVVKALELYRKGFAQEILITGLVDSPPDVKHTYLDWRVEFLVGNGIPLSSILFDNRSANSRDEARYTMELARSRGWEIVLVVSDPPHMRRLSMIWKRAFEGSGSSYLLVATTPAWWRERSWWQSEHTAQFVISEYIKIAYYLVYPDKT